MRLICRARAGVRSVHRYVYNRHTWTHCELVSIGPVIPAGRPTNYTLIYNVYGGNR
jgi:hypothetical protein